MHRIAGNLAALEHKQSMALMNETHRIKEDVQGMRHLLSGLRMQLLHVSRQSLATGTKASQELKL